MSLVATWVKCDDDCWYEEPCWQSPINRETGNLDWFICLDDDDPPELVIARGEPRPKFDWIKPVDGDRRRSGKRMLNFDKGIMADADKMWMEFRTTPPPPQRYDSKHEGKRPSQAMHWYEIKRK